MNRQALNIHRNYPAEQAILAFVVYGCEREQFEEIRSDLRGGCEVFWDKRHSLIWEAVQSLVEDGKAPDRVLVVSALESNGKLKEAGGLVYFGELASASAGLNCGFHTTKLYAQEVFEKYVLRTMMFHVEQFCETVALPGQLTSSDLMDRIDHMSVQLRKMSISVNPESDIKRELNGLISIYQNAEKGERIPCAPTGFRCIDRWVGGFRSSELVVIGARTKIGKTTLAVNICQHAAFHGTPTGIFTLEMTTQELLQRIVASDSGVPSKSAEDGVTTDAQKVRMVASMAKIARAPITILDQATITVDQIALQCREWKVRNGLKLVLIDHLHLISRPHGVNENEALGEITRKLKNLAGDLRIPIILASQLNRSCENDQRPPRLSDLRASGSIEQDANLIFLLHPDSQDETRVNIISVGRRCRSDAAKLIFNKDLNRFEDPPNEF